MENCRVNYGEGSVSLYEKFFSVSEMSTFPTILLKALEKSKYEQSLESVRHFIAVLEEELELYHRHVLCGDPNNRNTISHLDNPAKDTQGSGELKMLERENHLGLSSTFCEIDSRDEDVSETGDDLEGGLSSSSESDTEDALSSFDKGSKHFAPNSQRISCA